MNSKVALILCYFGKFPNYFPLYLQSCAYNPDFDWLIFTDNARSPHCPDNVRWIQTTFERLTNEIQRKMDFPLRIRSPYKLCDFKPLYGYLFQDYLTGYSHWGHCDLDLIWGDLSKFITDDLLRSYDRLFRYGHLSVYKNSPEVNRSFKLPYSGIPYGEILGSPFHFGFDEMKGIDLIFKDNRLPFYNVTVCANINFYHYDLRTGSEKLVSARWEKGTLTAVNARGETLEYAYIHLQKRKMTVDDNAVSRLIAAETHFISPDSFSEKPRLSRPLRKRLTFAVLAQWTAWKIRISWNFHWGLKWRLRKALFRRE